MAMMGDRMLRMKAIVHLQDRDTPLALHGVQHIFHPPASLPAHSVSDQVSRFVFITHNVFPDTVRQLYMFFNAKADSVAVLS
ncbi:GTP-binding protein [Halomonas sp. BC2]|uniref:GTP-binding protein n=1 Tax=unclassified Halomonas TaxID=2609666 RepID=UPI002015FD28|nr:MULTISPECIES: GTP-binding protein [unclassified Halomonas]